MINIPETGQKRIVIVGGGFAGIQLAKSLRRSQYQVVLVDKNNYHQFQPLFYQVATAGLEPSSIAFPLRKMFRKYKHIHIRLAEVEHLYHEEKYLKTSLGRLNYDYLVLAIGADTNYFGNKKLQELTIPMKSVSEALFLRNEILMDYESSVTTRDYENRQSFIDVVIVGGGATGVELAGALVEMKKYIMPKEYPELDCDEIDIYLIQSADVLLKGMSAEASEAAERFLTKMGVIVKKNTRVTDYDGTFVYTNTDEKIRAKKVIWAAGVTGNTIKGLPESSLVRGNRIVVDEYCQVEETEGVYAIGDIAFMKSDEFPYGHPQVAQVAIQQARLVGKNFMNNEKKRPLQKFTYKDLGTMATIGRNKAVADLPYLKTQGFRAWLLWLVVHLRAILGVKNKIFILINWVWNYFTYDQSLRLIIRPFSRKFNKPKDE